MTDKEKAEEYNNFINCAEDSITFSDILDAINNRRTIDECVDSINELNNKKIKQAYLDGLTEGRKEKWHDLRKDPNDLPKYNEEDDEGNFYLVAFRDFYNQEKIVTREFIWNGEEFLEEDYSEIPYFRKDDNLIAWCELPEFKE